jgi:regulator of protease activity HflC (stomatin/prohibitin superfamily)
MFDTLFSDPGSLFVTTAALLTGTALLSSMVFTVHSQEAAIVECFGQYAGTATAGLNL